eukprot:scaffold2907_cov161-Amphora_coffeaeformis.AAC.2
MSLSKTVALVTGGSSGLGAAAVQALRRHGAKVLIADLQEPMSLSQQEGQLNSSTLQWSKVDVTDPDSVTAALDHLQDTFGQPLNACIQCAGVATARKMISGKGVVHSLEDFARTIAINTNGTFNVARLAAERMTENAVDDDGLRGCFVHTASIAAYEGQIGQVAYAASKGAIVGMTLPMARDLAPLGIRVMTIVSARLCRAGNMMMRVGVDRFALFTHIYVPPLFHFRPRGCSRHPCSRVYLKPYKRNSVIRYPARVG